MSGPVVDSQAPRIGPFRFPPSRLFPPFPPPPSLLPTRPSRRSFPANSLRCSRTTIQGARFSTPNLRSPSRTSNLDGRLDCLQKLVANWGSQIGAETRGLSDFELWCLGSRVTVNTQLGGSRRYCNLPLTVLKTRSGSAAQTAMRCDAMSRYVHDGHGLERQRDGLDGYVLSTDRTTLYK